MTLKVEEQCVISGLAFNEPTKTNKVRVGLTVELLKNSSDAKYLQELSDIEVYYDTKNKDLITKNRWVKEYGDTKVVKYKKVKESNLETVEYDLIQDSVANIEKIKDLQLEVLGKFLVERQILQFRQGFTVYIDKATFPDGDPHCVCSIERVENIPRKTYELLRQHFIVPVRSKVCEYLYRYEPEIYQILSDNNYVQPLYEISVLDSQWDHIQSNPNLDQIIARVEGRNVDGQNPWDDDFDHDEQDE